MQSTQSDKCAYTGAMTLADLVRRDYRLSAVFDRYGLNYCSKGRRTLAQACTENDLDVDTVLAEMTQLSGDLFPPPPPRGIKMGELLDLLYEQYEPRLQTMLPAAKAKLQKVAASHGHDFPQTVFADEAMDQLVDELMPHLALGKGMVYPRAIEVLELLARGGPELAEPSHVTLKHLTHRLKMENRIVGRALSELRELTSGYAVPEGVCISFSVSFRQLADLDQLLSRFLEAEGERVISQLLAEPKDWS